MPNRVAVYRIMRQYFISEVPMYSSLQGAQQQMVGTLEDCKLNAGTCLQLQGGHCSWPHVGA